MIPKPSIYITKSKAGHYTATVILGRFKRSERRLSDLRNARAAAKELSSMVVADWARANDKTKATR